MRFFPFSLPGGLRGLAVGAMLGLTACGQAAPPAQRVPAPTSRVALRPQLAQPAGLSPVQTAVDFFAWYKRHRAQLTGLPLLTDADTAGNYAVDFTQTARFLRLLRGSGYVSPAYLKAWDRHFRQWGDSLRRHPINEGPAMGFDYELVLNSQDGDEYLAEMPTAPKRLDYYAPPDRALVVADFGSASPIPNEKRFYLRRYAGGWLIDSIGRD